MGQQVSCLAQDVASRLQVIAVATLGCGCVLALMATTQRLWHGELKMLRNRKGFTLIELLIVVVIIGILAAIAIPKFAATKDKAKLASVKTDLRNLETAQEAYFSDWSTYATSYATLLAAGELSLSSGNTMTVAGGASSYTATATNNTISTGIKTCTVASDGGGVSTLQEVIVCS